MKRGRRDREIVAHALRDFALELRTHHIRVTQPQAHRGILFAASLADDQAAIIAPHLPTPAESER